MLRDAYNDLCYAAAVAVEQMGALALLLPPTAGRRLMDIAYTLRDAQNDADKIAGLWEEA